MLQLNNDKFNDKTFSKWISKQHIDMSEIISALDEIKNGDFDTSLGGYLYKKRIRFKDRGKSGSGRTILCYKENDRAIFIHGFAKNEKENLSKKELIALKEFSKVLLSLSKNQISKAINAGDFKEIK